MSRSSSAGCHVVMHLDVDAFFASVEQVLDPKLMGKPVIVGSGVVASCSYESRHFGVRTGMSLVEARQICPHAIILAGDYGNYARFANRIEGICLDNTPIVEQSSLDDFYLDLTQCDALGTDVERCLPIAHQIQRQIRYETQLSCSLGLGRNKLFARLSSEKGKPGGVVALGTNRETDCLHNLPLRGLPGAGRKICQQMADYNVTTVAQFAALPESVLTQLFGLHGRTLWERAHGVDSRPVKPGRQTSDTPQSRKPSTISRETTLERPTGQREYLYGMVSYLAQRTAWDLRQRGLETRAVGVTIRYADYESAHSAQSLQEPTAEDRILVQLGRHIFDRLYTRRISVRHVGIQLSRFRAAETGQMRLFDETERRQQQQLRSVVDQIRARFGFQSVVEGTATELIGQLDQDHRGFRLRTPSLSR